jgi:archaeal flagellar protein FlaI
VNFLPFKFKPENRECGKACGSNLEACPTFQKLPENLKTKCKENLHLLQYLHRLPDEAGTPEFLEKLVKGKTGTTARNLIYEAGGGIFVHILNNSNDIRDHYIPIEPCLLEPVDEKLLKVEERLADFVDELEGIDDDKKRIEIILGITEKLVEINNNGQSQTKPSDKKVKNNGNGNGNGHKSKDKISVTQTEYQSLRYMLVRKLEGMGVLEPLIRDSNIEDISCSGLGKIYVEHKVFAGLATSIGFDEHQELDKFVIQLAERIKHPVTFRQPIVDATLPDGSRVNIVYGTDVSKQGSNFTIRKFSAVPISIIELIQFGALNYEMAAYLSIVLQEHMNAWVSGETASGKTTMINALTTFVPPEDKIVSIEDTPEIQVAHPNWIRGVTRESGKSGESSAVSMFDMLKAALRQRPNLIIVGEIRGAEGAIAFQAMQTGHACMSTFHAASVTKLIQRVTGNPISVPKTYVDNLNVVIICSMVRLPNGKPGRRVLSINEIVSYDSVSDSFSFMEVFAWNPIDDTFDFKGYMNSYLLEEKIAPRRGITRDKIKKIYAEVKRRAEILKRIHDQDITNFYEVYSVLSKAYREGLFK